MTLSFGFCQSVCIVDWPCQSKLASASFRSYVHTSLANVVRISIQPRLRGKGQYCLAKRDVTCSKAMLGREMDGGSV